MRCGAAGAVVVAGLLCAGVVRAERWELAGELRVGGVGIVASPGQLGAAEGDPSNSCGSNVSTDLGVAASGTGVALLSTSRYRYQLALSAGYYRFQCTPAMTRPVAGLDFRGEHRLGTRTVINTSARALVDQFDRSLDLRLAIRDQGGPNVSTPSGTPFLTASAGVELDHTFSGRYGVRGALAFQTLQLLAPEQQLSVYSTLGPMEIAEASLTPFRDIVRERLELPLRYQIGHYYAATLLGVRDRFSVAPSQDVSASFAWERRPNPLWTLRLSGGLAAAYQPNLCVQVGRDQLATDSCSIDRNAPGIRGADEAPPLEVALGRRATGTFIAEASLLYHDRRQVYELRLQRGYEPSPYAGALVLANRLSGNAQWRVTPDLVLRATGQLAQLGGSSPGRVIDAGMLDPMLPPDNLQLVAPQNRDFLAAQGNVGVDWFFLGPVALFAQVDAATFAIRGGLVVDSEDRQRTVSAFPQPGMSSAISRVSGTVGLRIAARPSAREPDLLQNARNLP